MGISFAQSLEQMKNEQSTDSVGTYAELLPAKKTKTFAEIDKPIMATDDWILSDEYKYYPDYFDDVVSSIDSRKNIILDSNQINITQETNSQFIPFKMSRYYDGFDLVNTRLSIYFINKNNRGYESTPINVYYNSSTIKFAWLTDRRVTAVSGKIRFEIRATGINSNGDEYVWKTKPCDGLNVIESLTGDITLPDDGENPEDASWVVESIYNLDKRVTELEYDPIVINYFRNNAGGAKEVGTKLDNLVLSWELSKPAKTLLLDSEHIDPELSKMPVEEVVTSNKTWKLVAVDERGTVSPTMSTSVSFKYGIYYGVAELPEEITSDFIKSFTTPSKIVLTDNGKTTISVNPTGKQYIWYCSPSRFGERTFKVGGVPGGFGLADTFQFENFSGAVEEYYVYRNGREGIGQQTVEVT